MTLEGGNRLSILHAPTSIMIRGHIQTILEKINVIMTLGGGGEGV